MLMSTQNALYALEAILDWQGSSGGPEIMSAALFGGFFVKAGPRDKMKIYIEDKTERVEFDSVKDFALYCKLPQFFGATISEEFAGTLMEGARAPTLRGDLLWHLQGGISIRYRFADGLFEYAETGGSKLYFSKGVLQTLRPWLPKNEFSSIVRVSTPITSEKDAWAQSLERMLYRASQASRPFSGGPLQLPAEDRAARLLDQMWAEFLPSMDGTSFGDLCRGFPEVASKIVAGSDAAKAVKAAHALQVETGADRVKVSIGDKVVRVFKTGRVFIKSKKHKRILATSAADIFLRND